MGSDLVFIITDSITNSVFHGQVLQSLIDYYKANPNSLIYLISFEKDPEKIKKEINVPDFISPSVFKRYPYFGKLSLYYSIKQLREFLKTKTNYQIIARGPLAGYIALKASNKTDCMKLTIQARGLLAEEYAYIHKNSSIFMRLMHSFRTKLYRNLEQSVYSNKKNTILIEAVSSALKQYLIEYFNADSHAITIASQDIPEPIDSEYRILWRREIRNKLGIPIDAYVYVYNGSGKPWQCPHLMIHYFAQKAAANTFLLIITQDKEFFEVALKQAQIPKEYYRIITVNHEEIYKYLSAADAGLLFREEHIINWISRPTKVLEYQAIGLPIIHNQTVHWLTEI